MQGCVSQVTRCRLSELTWLAHVLMAMVYSVRDRLIEFWNDTNQYFDEKNVKRV